MTFLVLLFAHLVADYPLQGDFLAKFKGERFLLMLTHGAIWTGCVAIAAYFCGITITDSTVMWLFSVHVLADSIKANKRLWCKHLDPLGAALWIDQAIHVAQLAVLVWMK